MLNVLHFVSGLNIPFGIFIEKVSVEHWTLVETYNKHFKPGPYVIQPFFMLNLHKHEIWMQGGHGGPS